QWEYACRAGTTGPYAGNLDDMAWYWVDATHPVGTKKPNAWGLYDMHGNVWEWCQDGLREYTSGRVTDPVGPDNDSDRPNRGGSWNNSAWYIRSACRNKWGKDGRYYNLGFRVLLSQYPEE
ncbi:MAG: formylglycine-generating enzyme family protein, partial [Thermoguttaceae bacterium]|nr:formylglycine-generating enzyme family protein [Thermoguttaceae bacterium]